MEKMLRYLYTGLYKALGGFECTSWEQHFAARTVAEKYLVTAMKHDVERELKALVQFMSAGVKSKRLFGTGLKEIVEVIEAMAALDDTFSKSIVDALLDSHLYQLIRDNGFRHMIEEDSALMLTCMDKIAASQESLVQLELHRCKNCQSQMVGPTGGCRILGEHCVKGCLEQADVSGPIWLRPKDHEGLKCLPKASTAPTFTSGPGPLFGTTSALTAPPLRGLSLPATAPLHVPR